MSEYVLAHRKLSSLVQYLDELATLLADCSLAEYKRNFERRHAIEKLAELIVEYATEMNRAILNILNETPPQTYYNSFREIARLGIIPATLMPRLASATGLRNRLVHRYDYIDNTIVYHSLKPLLRNYRKYAKLIEEYLRTEENKNQGSR